MARKVTIILLGLIIYCCILATIKMNTNQYLIEVFFKNFSFSVLENRLAIIGLFVFSSLICGKLIKGDKSIWINWGKVGFSILLLVAGLSFVICR